MFPLRRALFRTAEVPGQGDGLLRDLRLSTRYIGGVLRQYGAASLTVIATPIATMAPDVFATPPPLGRHESRTLVTGRDARARAVGMAGCLADVLAKVSGDAAVLTDPRLAGIDPLPLVFDHDDVDRVIGVPRPDELGRSDRPFWLTVRFDPTLIEAALRRLDRSVFGGARPPVMLSAVVRSATTTFLLDRDAGPPEHRAAALAAGERVGVPLRLPRATELAEGVAAPGLIPVTGTLTWSDAAQGWVAEWHVAWNGEDRSWGVSGVPFDEAYRVAMRGALGLLAGHPPDRSTPDGVTSC